LFIPGDLRIKSVRKSVTYASRAAFFDLDGTLWSDSGPGSILNYSELKLNHKSNSLIKELPKKGYIRIGFSNQTFFGYSRRYTLIMILSYRSRLRKLITTGVLDEIYICHHHPESKVRFLRRNCNRRKPSSGLLEWAHANSRFELSQSFAIGDRITDLVASQEFGIRQNFLIANNRSLEWNVSHQLPDVLAIKFDPVASLNEALLSILVRVSDGN